MSLHKAAAVIDIFKSHTPTTFCRSFSPPRKTGVNSTKSFVEFPKGVSEDIVNVLEDCTVLVQAEKKNSSQNWYKLTYHWYSTYNADGYVAILMERIMFWNTPYFSFPWPPFCSQRGAVRWETLRTRLAKAWAPWALRLGHKYRGNPAEKFEPRSVKFTSWLSSKYYC